MRTEFRVALHISPKAAASSKLAHALDAIAKGEVRLPMGVSVTDAEHGSITVRFARPHFVLEYDTVAVLDSLIFKLHTHFLIPPAKVRCIEARRDSNSLTLTAVCDAATRVSQKEAKRLSQKPSLLPGTHNHAALFITESVHPKTVQGGLPSSKRRK